MGAEGGFLNYLRTANERVAYRKVFYRNSDVYRNRLGIRDRAELEQRERQLTAERAEEGFPEEANFRTYNAFKAIHRHLFQDLYAWAGKERRYTTGRGAVPFAVPAYIARTMTGLFEELARDRYLVGRTKHGFADAAARCVNEINACHPFIDGNGRTQRFWLRMLANNAGFELTLASRDGGRWNEASRIGFLRSDHRPMAKLIERRLKRISSARREGIAG